ncbi:hypothetical protein H8D51_01925, partial [bacterium]|nr:hypothetical protein [bacterium]
VAEEFANVLADPDEGLLFLWDDGDAGFTSTPVISKDNTQPVVDDTTFEHNGLTITIDRTFYDEAGNPSEEYDSLTTVRLTRLRTVVGTIQRPRRTATIDHEGFIEVDGIAPDDTLRAINGEGHRNVESEFSSWWRPQHRTFIGEYTWSINDVLRMADREEYPYPLSGTIDATNHSIMTVETPNGSHTREVDIALTVSFDGSRYAEVTMDNGFVYWVDLETGQVYFDDPNGP